MRHDAASRSSRYSPRAATPADLVPVDFAVVRFEQLLDILLGLALRFRPRLRRCLCFLLVGLGLPFALGLLAVLRRRGRVRGVVFLNHFDERVVPPREVVRRARLQEVIETEAFGHAHGVLDFLPVVRAELVHAVDDEAIFVRIELAVLRRRVGARALDVRIVEGEIFPGVFEPTDEFGRRALRLERL